jgi:hypothetical protein
VRERDGEKREQMHILNYEGRRNFFRQALKQVGET